MPILRYEDFCQAPQTVLDPICKFLGVQPTASFQDYEQYDHVDGDTQGTASRGIRQGQIALLPRRWVPKKRVKELHACSHFHAAMKLGAYPASYYAGAPPQRRIQHLLEPVLSPFLPRQ